MAYEGTPYQHPEEGYVDSVRSITLDDVRGFYKRALPSQQRRRRHRRRLSGRVSRRACARTSTRCPTAPRRRDRRRRAPNGAAGVKVLLVEKETDASAISFGFPIALRRSASGLRAAARRQLVSRRAPQLCRAPLPGDPRDARDELRQLLVHRGVPGRLGDAAAARERRAAQPALRDLDPAGLARPRPGTCTTARCSPSRAALVRAAAARRQGDDAGGGRSVEAVPAQLRRHLGHDAGRRLGYAVDDAFYGIPAPGYLPSLRGGHRPGHARAGERRDPPPSPQRRDLSRGHHRRRGGLQGQAAARARRRRSATTPSRRPTSRAEDEVIGVVPLTVRDADVTILPIDRVFSSAAGLEETFRATRAERGIGGVEVDVFHRLRLVPQPRLEEVVDVRHLGVEQVERLRPSAGYAFENL